MTTAELIAKLQEIDPNGELPFMVADEYGAFERTDLKRQWMQRDEHRVYYDDGKMMIGCISIEAVIL